jgi:uncharacterized membrane protein
MTPIESAVKTLYWFFLYGFIGWGVEVVYAAIKTHKLVNRGFLCGPICPIYGFGMVGLIYSVSLIPMPDSGSMSAVAIFFIGMILTTAIELVGGWALFKTYHIRWWDYSNMKFNLGGYICPQFSLLWGLGSVLMIKVVHPLLARGSSPMPFNIMLIVDVVLLVLFVVDVAASTAAAIGLNKYLREIDELRAKLEAAITPKTKALILCSPSNPTGSVYTKEELAGLSAVLAKHPQVIVIADEIYEHINYIGAHQSIAQFPEMKERTVIVNGVSKAYAMTGWRIGFYEGKDDTRHKGRLGGFVLKQEDGQECECGSGFSDEDRDYIWNNKKEFLGRTVEVKYQEKTNHGILRFPVFMRFRDDKGSK